MVIMDLSINQEEMGVQSRLENQVFKLNNFEETDVKKNNNLYNCRKTDTDSDSGSLFKDGYSSENLQVDPSLFSYSSFKKAMDLRTHNRTDDESRTIFEDADYFAKNFFYKLLPITFEQVDETIIHTEHNYSLFSLHSESETEEDCSRTMGYSQIKEKNYKRRRTKFKEGSDEEVWDESKDPIDCNENTSNQNELPTPELEIVPENSVQPLDLSTTPPVQEQKTDNHHLVHLKEHSEVREENLSPKLKCIQVTITRPDEKENYQPCDMFLNDIARLVPRLINNDCFEIDILDKTGDRHDDFRKHRLYYIIAESTWRLFQSTRERVILTNDQTLGPPVKKIEKDERPTFLVFDQFSLAKCLAEYCEEIGGCFEYTCVEEGKDNEKEEDAKSTKIIELVKKAIDTDTEGERLIGINSEETEIIETAKEKIQEDELSIKLKEVIAEEVTTETKYYKSVNEDTSSDNIETVEIKSEEAKNESTCTEFISEKIGKQDEKIGERNTNQTVSIDVEINEIKTNATEENEIKFNSENLTLNIHQEEKKTRKLLKSRIKKENLNKKKSEMNMRSFKSHNICTEVVKSDKIEREKIKSSINSDESRMFARNFKCPKPDNTDTKEEIEKETHMGNIQICLTDKTEVIETNFENKKLVEENSEDKMRDEEIKIFDKRIKSDEENKEKASEVRSRKRTRGMNETKVIKKGEKFKHRAERIAEEASLVIAKKTKIANDAKEETIKENKRDKKETRRVQTDKKGSEETKVGKRGLKLKNESQSVETTKETEKLEGKSKIKQSEVEIAEKPPSRKRRKKIKSKSNLSHAVSLIKTRSKSTSESETSQKPNKETQKAKNTAKEPAEEVGRAETFKRRTRSGKELEEKKEDVKVKGNGRGVKGRKRKIIDEEEVLYEKCLRSRRGKEKTKTVGTSSKRKKS